jgi:dihydroflavonol-4-reductase
MIRDAAAGKMPAYVETGLNLVHVDDVAEGHMLAFEKGRVGERYILGGEDMSLKTVFALVSDVAGVRAPRIQLGQRVLWPVAVASEALARGFGIEPRVTREMLAMSKKKMFFSSDKARRELGYAPRPAREAVTDAVDWFRQAGMI